MYGYFTRQACPAFLNPSNDTFPKGFPQLPNGLSRVSPRQQAGRFKQIGMRWCPGPESNRYGRNGREILSLLCLPISPPGQTGLGVTAPLTEAAKSYHKYSTFRRIDEGFAANFVGMMRATMAVADQEFSR